MEKRRENVSDEGRRNLIKALPFIILAPGLLVTACTVPKPQSIKQEVKPGVDEGKKRLNEELDKLPDSIVKSLLFARIKPLFGPNPPEKLNYDGLDIKAANPAVILETVNTNSVSGHSTFRDISYKPDPLFPTKKTNIRFPYLGLVSDAEKPVIIPKDYLAKDGTILLDIVFSTDKPFIEGFSHSITVTAPDPSFVKPERRQNITNLERFCYIKEACSLLLIDIFTEETVKKIHELGLNIFLGARTQNKTKQAEVLTQSLAVLSNSLGRFTVAVDLGGYLLAFKAIEGTDIDNPDNFDPNFVKLMANIRSVTLGTSSQEVLYNSFDWSLNTPEASSLLHHLGTLNKIP
ncbi:MAG: hypothetical protein M1514_03880 [Patescibacteria group bacterium]|nr:hypothetical protein [Patescibacteria group bacterium]